MIKVIVGIGIIACIAPFFINGPNGEPLMTLDDWSFELPDQLSSLFGKAKEAADTTEPMAVYKWQDEDGQWHFSSAPPNPELAEEVEISAVNLMDAVELPEEKPVAATEGGALPSVSGMGPQQIQEAMRAADQLQQSIDQRKADLDAIPSN